MWVVPLGALLFLALPMPTRAEPEASASAAPPWQYVLQLWKGATYSYVFQDDRLVMVEWKWGAWTVTWPRKEQSPPALEKQEAEPNAEMSAENCLPDRKDLTPVSWWQDERQLWNGVPDYSRISDDSEEWEKQAKEAKARERPLCKNFCLCMEPACSFTWALSVMQALQAQMWRESHVPSGLWEYWGSFGMSNAPVDETDRDLHQLLHLEEQVRLEGVKGLGRRKVDQAVDALTCMVTDDPCPAVREAAARSLALIGTRSHRAQTALFALERAAREDNDPRVRHAAEFAAEIIQLAEE